MSKFLKGGPFNNRYVFKAQITLLSPLHIGSGKMIERPGMVDDKNKPLQISAVIVDGKNKPYIPGSSLRGAMRDWLREVWGEQDRKSDELFDVLKGPIDETKKKFDEPEKIAKEIAKIIKCKKRRLELLFGSTFAEGKIEVWDAPCTSVVNTPTNNMLSGWDKERLTYIAKSVAINPETGIAEDKKLYNIELVPEGARFNVTLTGQNLTDEDVALVLNALDGFKHPTSQLVLGSMTKRGFGRFSISELDVYRLTGDKISQWKNLCQKDDLAGYYSICRTEFKIEENEIAKLKEVVKCSASGPDKLITQKTIWSITLETPLVVRSGSKFGWKNAPKSKTRNYQMQYKWGETTLDEIADIYFSLKINDNKVEPYYHIPSSSIRGSLREWTIKHLLPEEWWDIEGKLKDYAKQPNPRPTLPGYLDDILKLFGFVLKTCDKQLDKQYTCATKLTIEVSPFTGNYSKPKIDGEWDSSGNKFGPTNADRHIKTRNPLDRITNAAKETGLHSGLEFSKGQKFEVALIIQNPTNFDKKLVDNWFKEINYGMIRFGGLTSIGRGRVEVQEVKDGKS